jgi:hypothetical protein
MNYEELKELIKQTEFKRTLLNPKYDKAYFNNVFKPLLNLGQEFEKVAIKRLIKYHNYDENIKVYSNDTNKYDVMLNNISYEIKTDIRAATTNNIFVEFIQNGKLSGISTTEADNYIIVIPYEKLPLFILIDVLELQFLIQTMQYKNIIQPNKHNNFTSGYIFDVQTIIKNSKLI